jgi:hypothetical protein
LVFESFVFEPMAEGSLQPRHAGLNQAAAMVSDLLFPAPSAEAANAPSFSPACSRAPRAIADWQRE